VAGKLTFAVKKQNKTWGLKMSMSAATTSGDLMLWLR